MCSFIDNLNDYKLYSSLKSAAEDALTAGNYSLAFKLYDEAESAYDSYKDAFFEPVDEW